MPIARKQCTDKTSMTMAFFLRTLLLAILSLLIPAFSATIISTSNTNNTLLVHLDYGSFQGKYDPTYNLTYFRKIPFAAPPTGNNRFRAPQPPASIPNGHGPYDTDQDFDMCPQRTVNGSEDCLYLGLFSRPWSWDWDRETNVSASASAASQAQAPPRRPVLVVFYGGAFIQGSASFTLPPSSYPVLNVSSLNDYVVVYPNYRVNAFGFLPGRAIKESPISDLNPGLLDQQYALKWVQKYIGRFGGDPGNVTIWGQSAGGGSVVAQVLAANGDSKGKNKNTKLFSKALASSPFWPKTYRYDAPQAEDIYSRLVNLTGCGTGSGDNSYQSRNASLACLKAVDVQTIRDASLAISGTHTYTTSSYTWAPVIEDEFLTETLTEAVNKNDNKYLSTEFIFGMYNTHEGENFVPSTWELPSNSTSSTSTFRAWLTGFVPGLSPREIRLIESTYYPPAGTTETTSYNSTVERAGLVYRDLVLACPAYWLAKGAGRAGYLGEYTILPAKHASDTIYWNRVNAVQQSDPEVYEGYAGAFASFFQTGDPNAHKLTGASQSGVPRVEGQRRGEAWEWEWEVTEGGFWARKLGQLKERCGFWQGVGRRVPV